MSRVSCWFFGLSSPSPQTRYHHHHSYPIIIYTSPHFGSGSPTLLMLVVMLFTISPAITLSSTLLVHYHHSGLVRCVLSVDGQVVLVPATHTLPTARWSRPPPGPPAPPPPPSREDTRPSLLSGHHRGDSGPDTHHHNNISRQNTTLPFMDLAQMVGHWATLPPWWRIIPCPHR